MQGSHADLPNEQKVSEAIQIPVKKKQLKNGLTVLMYENHSAPFFSYQQWFKVGSINEEPGRTGLAHFFEHLMFKGTTKYPGGSIDKLIGEKGGVFNAFTTYDFTAYHMELPTENLELAVDLESDRMIHLNLNLEQIKSEREVVKEERRLRIDNEILGLLQEKLWKITYLTHPYRSEVIGSMEDLGRASLQDFVDFYKTHYSPNNAVVVVVGDFEPKKLETLLDKYYSKIPAQTLPSSPTVVEAVQKGERRAKIIRPVQNISVGISYKTVKATDKDSYALDILAHILGAGSSSRLYKKLVRNQQFATQLGVSSMGLADSGLFMISLSLKPEQDLEKVLSSLFAEIYRARKEKVTVEELENAKNAVMKEFVEGLKTFRGVGHALAVNEIYFGDYQKIFTSLKDYLKVTTEDILNVANKYLQPQSRSIVTVEPQKELGSQLSDKNTAQEE